MLGTRIASSARATLMAVIQDAGSHAGVAGQSCGRANSEGLENTLAQLNILHIVHPPHPSVPVQLAPSR
jgi:hypothetical protein